MNDDTPMCERHEVNYIQLEGYQNRDSHDSYSHQSYYEQSHSNNDFEKSLTELNNDVKNDLEDFKSWIHSMRSVHDKLFDKDDQSKTDLEKPITKFLDGQRVTNIFGKNNVNDKIIMKQNKFQTIYKNMERKIDEWSKSQNHVSLEQTNRNIPPTLPQAHIEQVNVVFTGSGKSDDPLKIQKDPPPPSIINNKIDKDKPIKTTKRDYYIVTTKEYPFREYIPKIPYP
nr:sec23/sec24 transport family protein [Tanacetum cinerariifolium]